MKVHELVGSEIEYTYRFMKHWK